ncbi:MAG: hypothetical protein PHY08_01540 [Candidatus Cloacimonetes bacterium]|nr:hypothetical protein [Candidatus Cloacimonadota bacterium]
MKKILSNQKGFSATLAVAMVLVAVAASSIVSFVNMIHKDNNLVMWEKDKTQQELLSRSETKRLNMILEKQLLIIPARVVEIIGKDRVSTYTLRHKKSTVTVADIIGIASEAVKFETLCETKHSRQYLPGAKSPVKTFTEKLSQRQSLAMYQYFSDSEISDITDDPDSPAARVKFWGKDELHGKVHSNDNIWIQNAGTPPVNPSAPNWPWFHDKVTTAGQIFIYQTGSATGTPLPGSCPVALVFEDGYEENVPYIEYLADATDIRKNGDKPFGLNISDNIDIIMAKINGSTIQMTVGDIAETETKAFTVYDFYPDALIKNPHWSGDNNNHPHLFGDSLFTNYITMKDTTWTSVGDAGVSGTSIFLPAEVWVGGNVSGEMTIGTAKDAYVIDNILYNNTPVGTKPDDPDNINTIDYFGLVSEGKVLIKYKYRDPLSNAIIDAPMSTGPNGNIYLYGAYAAIGDNDPSLGDFDYKADGVFSYEYQHPHGTPTPFWGQSAYTGNDTLFSFIDFHRIKFPPNRPTYGVFNNMQWPGAVGMQYYVGYPMANNPLTDLATSPHYAVYDYPWYNPVYPESGADLVFERGNLWVYGSIAQRRRGFIHRSGNESPDNPDTSQMWDPARFVFGPTHQSTGYDKQYFYDRRFMYKQPPDYPEVYQGSSAGRMSAFDDTSWNFKVPPRNWGI